MYRNEDHNRRGDHSPRRGSTDRRVTEYIYFRVKSRIIFMECKHFRNQRGNQNLYIEEE
jgi:hypothetical protein